MQQVSVLTLKHVLWLIVMQPFLSPGVKHLHVRAPPSPSVHTGPRSLHGASPSHGSLRVYKMSSARLASRRRSRAPNKNKGRGTDGRTDGRTECGEGLTLSLFLSLSLLGAVTDDLSARTPTEYLLPSTAALFSQQERSREADMFQSQPAACLPATCLSGSITLGPPPSVLLHAWFRC